MHFRLQDHLRQGIPLARDDLCAFLSEQRDAVIAVGKRHLAAVGVKHDVEALELQPGWTDPGSLHPTFEGPSGMLAATLGRAAEHEEEFWRQEHERWAAWFADVATLALQAVVDDAPASPVRVLAGAPGTRLTAEDIEALGLNGRVYQAELRATGPAVGDSLLEQLWPDTWTTHAARLPTLPAPGHLAGLLAAATSQHGMSPGVVDRIQGSHARVLDSLAAADEARRIQDEADERGPDDDPRADECWARFDRRHEHLIAYATAITDWV